MEYQIETTHGLIMNAADNGVEAGGVCGEVRGRAQVGDLGVQMVESIEQGAKVEVSLDGEGEVVVGEGFV